MAFVAVAGRFPFLQLKGEMVPTAISLESKLKGLARNNKDAEMLYGKYCEVKRYLTESYYNWIQASSPFLTDHGERHIESVIHAASCLLYDYHNDALRREPSALELYLLLSAILWHDVGNVHGRSGHAERVPEMAQEIARLAFPDITIQRLVSEIAIAHSGPAGLSKASSTAEWSSVRETFTVYPRALAAILRFADEISETRARISVPLLPDVPPDSQIYWQYAHCVAASRPDPGRERVILTFEIQADTAVTSFPCSEPMPNLDAVNPSATLIEYIVWRLQKVNNERAYCAPEFRMYAVVRSIEARLALYRGIDRVPEYDLTLECSDAGLRTELYPKIKIFDEFFESHRGWHPSRLREAFGTAKGDTT